MEPEEAKFILKFQVTPFPRQSLKVSQCRKCIIECSASIPNVLSCTALKKHPAYFGFTISVLPCLSNSNTFNFFAFLHPF